MKSEQQRFHGPVSAALAGIADSIRRRDAPAALSDGERLDGLTALVTGGSSGLGFASVSALARRGARVIAASRRAGPELEQRLSRELADLNGRADVRALPLDLSRFDSVIDFVRTLEREGRPIHLLASNAGLVTAERRHTEDGFDEMLQVNYLGPYLLVRRLLAHDLLVPSTERRPRLIFVSSEAHRNAPDPDARAPFRVPRYGMSGSMRYYGYSKLLLTSFTEELSRRLNPAGVGTRTSIFALCPGAMRTNIAREAPALLRPLLSLVFALLFPSPRQAVEPVTYLAASRELEGETGLYLHLMTRKRKDPRALDADLGSEIWQRSEEMLRHYL